MNKLARSGSLVALGVLIVVGAAVILYQRKPVVAEAEKGSRHLSGHSHHAPPGTRGSQLYQYASPDSSEGPAGSVYPAEAPPITPAVNGIREFELVVEEDVPHEVAPGVIMPAWTFNRTVPAPVLRATEGDRVRITLVNKGKLPHTIHFHGIHPANMDGVFELVAPGQSYTYDFVVRPYGVFPYHCHSNPSSQHIHNGLYGMFIVDPKTPRPKAKELAMMMSAFDLDRDGEADFYAWNGRAFQYADHPVELKKGEPVRMYVLNMFEESMVPHMHGTLYHLFPSGTTLTPTEYTDVKTLNIAERAILEFTYDFPGTYMFQCHVSEHMEQGLMGWFKVVDEPTQAKAHSAH